jgi:hypothetical protein
MSLNAKQFHYAFGNMLTEEESDALHEAWTIPGPGKPLFEGASANLFPHSPAKVETGLADRGPLLLTSGTDDHTVPLKVTKEVVAMYEKSQAVTDFRGPRCDQASRSHPTARQHRRYRPQRLQSRPR